jgi:hypothetical protein
VLPCDWRIMSESTSLAPHVRELVGRLVKITVLPWSGDIHVDYNFTTKFDSFGIGRHIRVPQQESESLAITAASEAVARWLGENGYDGEGV